MTWDEKGNLLPKMASALVEDLQKIIDEEGDLPVWIEVDWPIYECGDVKAPLSNPPTVKKMGRRAGLYWPGRFERLISLKARED